MSLPRLRRRVAAAEFDAWRAALPGLGLPGWVDEAPAPRPAAVRGVTVPPMVAAALALHGDPAVCVLFRVRGPGGTVSGAVAQEDGVVSSVVRHRSAADGEAWAEVALVPVDRLVGEVLRWVPARLAAGTLVEVRVLRHDDAVACGRWRGRAGPDDEAEGSAAGGLRERLGLALTACLAGCLAGCPVSSGGDVDGDVGGGATLRAAG